MIPLMICLLFIGYLFWTDLRRRDGLSNALWVPLAWMFLAGSRYVSSWLNLGPTFTSAVDYSEGSPLDAAAFFSLIVAGVVILARRKVDWSWMVRNNILIVVYFLFCLSSIAWTDDSFVLLKRWIKDLGNPIMALVILTESRPYEAAAAVLRRLAFLLIPLSALFIRYFPGLGRDYRGDGSPMYTGVGHQKNDLGSMCFLSGVYLAYEFLVVRGNGRPTFIRQNKVIAAILAITTAYLLRMSDSKTSLVCLVVVCAIFLLARISVMARSPDLFLGVLFGAAGLSWLLDQSFGLKDTLFALLGRDPSLTNRTELWAVVGQLAVDPLLGAGFMSFWSGARMQEIWNQLGEGINQAHNGYLEQYLNLGYIGVALIVMVIAGGLLKVRHHMKADPASGLLRLSFIATAIVYNTTEASFYGINNLWLLLLLGCLEVPRKATARAASGSPGERRPLSVPGLHKPRSVPRSRTGYGHAAAPASEIAESALHPRPAEPKLRRRPPGL